MRSGDRDLAADPVVCSGCGRTASAGAALTWTTQLGDRAGGRTRGARRLCDDCTRTHLRGIEGRLDEQWW